MILAEKDLENIIFEAQKTEQGRMKLRERGLCVSGKFYRQVNLAEYGVVDLLSINKNISPYPEEGYITYIEIFELKKDVIKVDALIQIARYKTAINHLFNNFDNINISINLIGLDIDTSNDFVFLCNLIEDLSIYSYSYDLEGLKFECENQFWHFTDTPLLDSKIKALDFNLDNIDNILTPTL